MQQGRGVFCLVIFIIMVFLLPTVGLAGGTDSEQLSEEIRVLKSKLAEMDDLKAKLSELESKVSEVQTVQTEQQEAISVKIKKTEEN